MDQNPTPEQVEKALKLCDILGLEDIDVSIMILSQVDWSIDKAIDIMQDQNKKQKPKPKQQEAVPVPSYYDPNNNEQQQQENYDTYQYDFYNPNQDIDNKRRQFEQGFELNKLDRSTSQPPTQLEKRLSYDRRIIQDYSNHRHSYQVQLLEDAEKLCKKIIGEESEQFKGVNRSRIKNNQNRRFICQLDRRYHTKINFTFGTFMLNLVRSYLDKKYLLVYIHCTQQEDSQSIKMLLTQKQIANLINTNCVSYGMFDNSDDYQFIQKHVPMKDLPAFALFKYSKKTRKQKFISSYPILQKQPSNFMQWLASSIGISLKKKDIPAPQIKSQEKNKQLKTKQTQPSSQHARPDYTHRDIMRTQNQQYEQMERIWKLKRQQSKLKKEEIQKAEQMIAKMRQRFKDQPKLEQGVSIQIRFRLPESGKSLMRVFKLNSKVKQMFDYINCFGRDEFEQKYGNFDLTQTFPRLNLSDKQDKLIKQVFEGSSHENLIVKQI